MRHPFRPYPRFSLTKMNLVRPYPNLSPECHIVHNLAKHENHMNSVWTLFWDKRTSRQTILQALRASHGIVPTAPSCKHKVEEKHRILLKAQMPNGFLPQNNQCLNTSQRLGDLSSEHTASSPQSVTWYMAVPRALTCKHKVEEKHHNLQKCKMVQMKPLFKYFLENRWPPVMDYIPNTPQNVTWIPHPHGGTKLKKNIAWRMLS